MMHFQEKDGLSWEKLVQLLHRNWKGVGSERPDFWYCGSSGDLPWGLDLFAPQLHAHLLWSQQGSPFTVSLALAMQNRRPHMVKVKQVHVQNQGVASMPCGR